MSTVLTRREERQYEHLKQLETKSIHELRERAGDLNIEDRFRMNKRELLQAIWLRYN